ncbi:MAG: preprotein translocase, YajC subunit [Caulobacteraceae bacterium]|nr:preprotein translocase, YajC subunit [Caulobacteraceae bacterium]
MFGTPAFAQTAVPAAGPGGLQDLIAGPLPMVVLMMVLFYFLLIRPQQKRMKEHQNMVKQLKRGDTVVLSSGVIGKVTKVEDVELGIEIAPNVAVKVVRSMVSEVRARSEPAAANDAKNP